MSLVVLLCLTNLPNALIEARLLLRTWRDENMRMSQDILELWERLVCSNINKYGDESNDILCFGFMNF